jgi:hypothetical protein
MTKHKCIVLRSCFTAGTGFTYSELTPHKITPMPGVHKKDRRSFHKFCPAVKVFGLLLLFDGDEINRATVFIDG